MDTLSVSNTVHNSVAIADTTSDTVSPVHNSMQMTLMNPAQNLVQEFLDHVWAKDAIAWIVSPFGNDVPQITVAIFEHKVDLIDLWDDVEKFDEIWVLYLVKFLQSGDFPEYL